ncbi:energy transducer TonB [Alteromonas sp. V450]|uniref:M56 family metallopeptidase n=1 Tax=Alteromonas sp. V450 TaxID=1912139 RepID=UPI0008FF38A2|nr:M56 family metallopeptidase [Alteromonas sp. V450]OJF68879.1 energy transducer TonB [Alteromonas sp. V450]
MIEWIIAQQGILSLTLVLLVASEHFFTSKLGVSLMYKLWALVPCCLLVNNLPMSLVSIPANHITHYIVGVKPMVNNVEIEAWLTLWLIGACMIASYILVHHITTWASIGKRRALHINAYYSSKATTPMLFGFIAPKVLIPFSFKSTFSKQQQAMVLEHENVHRKHYDHVWNALALAIAIVFWFNPFVWLALKSFRINQELACDRAVLKNKTENEKLIYAKALVQCAEHCSNALHYKPGLYLSFGEKNTMIKRLNAIKQPVHTNRILAITAVSIAALLTINTALANVPPPPPKPEAKTGKANINEATPIVHISPIYPTQAAKEDIEGFVVLSFDITETGTTDNLSIVKSEPTGVFDESAKIALEQWKYKPRIQGGKGVRQTGLLVQMDFKLDSSDNTND